jgi:hypothetical protein
MHINLYNNKNLKQRANLKRLDKQNKNNNLNKNYKFININRYRNK